MQGEDTPELLQKKKIQSSLNIVANQFVDPVKAEDFLHKLYMRWRTTVSLNSLAVLLNYSTTTSQAISAHMHLAIGSSLNLSVCRCRCCDYLNLGVFKLNLILLGCPGTIAAPLSTKYLTYCLMTSDYDWMILWT